MILEIVSQDFYTLLQWLKIIFFFVSCKHLPSELSSERVMMLEHVGEKEEHILKILMEKSIILHGYTEVVCFRALM